MRLWYDGDRVKLGPDLSRIINVYKKGGVVEMVNPRPTPAEYASAHTLIRGLREAGLLKEAA